MHYKGRLRRKTVFYDELKSEMYVHGAGDFFTCLCDFNGHVGRHINGFDGVHEGHSVGLNNLKG